MSDEDRIVRLEAQMLATAFLAGVAFQYIVEEVNENSGVGITSLRDSLSLQLAEFFSDPQVIELDLASSQEVRNTLRMFLSGFPGGAPDFDI